jgi:hypothetical protein
MLVKKRVYTKEVEQDISISIQYVNYFKILRHHKMNSFDDEGNIINVIKNIEHKVNGLVFMNDIITFFISRDEAYAYRICAQLQVLIDEYKLKFTC